MNKRQRNKLLKKLVARHAASMKALFDRNGYDTKFLEQLTASDTITLVSERDMRVPIFKE